MKNNPQATALLENAKSNLNMTNAKALFDQAKTKLNSPEAKALFDQAKTSAITRLRGKGFSNTRHIKGKWKTQRKSKL